MCMRPAKTNISLGIRPVSSESTLSAWRKLRSLATHKAHGEDWSDWADAHADLSLCWAHGHFAGFVMSRLICVTDVEPILSQVKPSWTSWNLSSPDGFLVYKSSMWQNNLSGILFVLKRPTCRASVGLPVDVHAIRWSQGHIFSVFGITSGVMGRYRTSNFVCSATSMHLLDLVS